MRSFIVWNFPASWHLPGLDRKVRRQNAQLGGLRNGVYEGADQE
jgi:hypothetical protein